MRYPFPLPLRTHSLPHICILIQPNHPTLLQSFYLKIVLHNLYKCPVRGRKSSPAVYTVIFLYAHIHMSPRQPKIKSWILRADKIAQGICLTVKGAGVYKWLLSLTRASIASTTSAGVVTCHVASVFLLLAPTDVENTPEGSMAS